MLDIALVTHNTHLILILILPFKFKKSVIKNGNYLLERKDLVWVASQDTNYVLISAHVTKKYPSTHTSQFMIFGNTHTKSLESN